jgi:hypothetical protein
MTQEIMMVVEQPRPIVMQTTEFVRGGGSSDYDALTNKPSINGVTLEGNKTTAELGLPTKTSDLDNDSGFLTSAPVTSVNGQTGAVTIAVPSTAADVGAVAVAQGAAKANQFLVTDASGNVTTKTLESWQAQSY